MTRVAVDDFRIFVCCFPRHSFLYLHLSWLQISQLDENENCPIKCKNSSERRTRASIAINYEKNLRRNVV